MFGNAKNRFCLQNLFLKWQWRTHSPRAAKNNTLGMGERGREVLEGFHSHSLAAGDVLFFNLKDSQFLAP